MGAGNAFTAGVYFGMEHGLASLKMSWRLAGKMHCCVSLQPHSRLSVPQPALPWGGLQGAWSWAWEPGLHPRPGFCMGRGTTSHLQFPRPSLPVLTWP